MSFNANTYRTKKSALKNYGASPNFVNATMWQHTTTGLELVDATDELPFKVLIVGRISAFRLKSGPGGNHVLNGLGSLDKAKYQFHMSRPADADLAKDYNAAIAAMETLQKQVATTKDQRNMVITDVTGKMIRFVRNVFELRENVVPDSPNGRAAQNATKMDQETENWEMPEEFAKEFEGIKYHYRAERLPVYYEDVLIQPGQVNEVLNGAIVEVEFTMRHWRIQDYDSFQATPHKITVLRLGPYHHKSNYKNTSPDIQLDEHQQKRTRTSPDVQLDQPQPKKTRQNATAGSSKT